MAEHPDLGGVSVSLNAAIAAIEKNKGAIADLEKKADARQAKLAEEEAQEEQRIARSSERGKRQKAVRAQNVTAAEEESAAIEGTDTVRAREAAATDASTAAIRRNAAARREEATAAQAQARAVQEANAAAARTPVPGAFAGSRQPPIPAAELEARAAARRPIDPTFWPAALGPRKRSADPFEGIPRVGPSQEALYADQVGKEVAERARREPFLRPLATGQRVQLAVNEAYGLPTAPGVVFGPEADRKRLIEGGIGAQNLATDDPKVFAKYAQRAGWIKAATKARKEATRQAIQEAKAADAEEAAVAQQPPRKPPTPPPVAVAPVPEEPQKPLASEVQRAERTAAEVEAERLGLSKAQKEVLTQVEAADAEGAVFGSSYRRTVESLERRGLVQSEEFIKETPYAQGPRGGGGPRSGVYRESAFRVTPAGVAPVQAPPPAVEPPAPVVVPTEAVETPPVVKPAVAKAPPPVVEPPAPVVVPTVAEETVTVRRALTGAALTPEELYRQDRAIVAPPIEERALPAATVSLRPAAEAIEGQTATQEAIRAEAAARKEAAAEAVSAQKAAETTMLEDQRAFEQRSVAETGLYAKSRAAALRQAALVPFGPELAAEKERAAYGLTAGGAGKPPARPPVAVGGAGGAGGGEPPYKAVSGAEEESAALAEKLAQREAQVRETFARSGAVLASYSTQLQRHGALTSEFIQGLARGEVTIKEFQSQMLTTIGKFGGWAVAGGLVYGAYETVKLFARGISDTQSGVEELKRSLGEKVNVPEAEAGFRQVSKEVNVPIRDVAKAQFFSARAFPSQQESLEVARVSLKASKLDEIPGEEAARAFGSLAVNFKLNAKEVAGIFDILDVGQQKFNARINQTLPQMARAAAAYANAGGSAKELAVQLVELNRITIGGGQGGGNPATFLTREPANLGKSATEQTLRRYGFDPQYAQEHIGDFNRKLQERAALPPGTPRSLGDTAEAVKRAVKEIADQIGTPALGQRYGIPFINAGPSGLAARIEEAATTAHGAAQEDLNHKLGQFDERVKSLGVTLENIGSEVGSAGLGKLATDLATGLSYFEKLGGIVIQPLVALGSVITGLPGPVREFAEALLLVKGGLRLARSERGLAARGIVENVVGGQYGGPGTASEVLGAQRTQREIDARIQRLAEQQTDRLFTASFAAQSAFGRAKAFEKPAEEVAALGPEARAAYDEELLALQQTAIDKAKALAAVEADQLAAQAELAKSSETLAVLTDKRVAAQAKLAAYAEAGGFIAQGGFPNRNPLLAPTAASAAAEAQRTGFLVDASGAATAVTRPTQVVAAQQKAAAAAETAAAAQRRAAAVGAAAATGAATAQEAAAYAQTAAAATEAAAAEAAAAAQVEAGAAQEVAAASTAKAALVGNGLLAAGYKAQQLGAAVTGLTSRLGGFFAGLGPLGAAVTAFVGFEALSDVFGVPEDVKGRGERIKALAEPTSEADALKKLADERKRLRPIIEQAEGKGKGESGVERFKHGLEEARAIGDKALGAIPFVGGLLAGPEERAHDQVAKEIAAAKKLQGQVKGGQLKSLGTGGELGEGELLVTTERYATLIESVEKGGKAGQEASSKIQGLNKHLSDQLGFFGNTSYGKQAGEKLATGSSQLLKAALANPNKPELLEDASAGLSSALSSFSGAVERTTKREAQFAKTTKQRQEIIGKAQQANKRFVDLLTGPAKAYQTEDLNIKEGLLEKTKQQEITTPSNANRAKLQARRKELEGQIARTHQALLDLASIANDVTQSLADSMSKIVEGVVIKGIESHTKLLEAKAGGNQQAKDKIRIKGEDEVLKTQEKYQPENKKYLKEEREGKDKEARDKLTVSGLDKVRREAERRSLGAGPSATDQARANLGVAEAEANEVLRHKHAYGPEKVDEATLKVAQARKAVSESLVSEAKKSHSLATQIAEARDQGNALAQAADAIAGAARAAAEAKTPEEHEQATLDAINAANQKRQAQQAHVESLGELKESREPNPLAKDKEKLHTLKKALPFATHDDKIKLQAEINNETRKLHEDEASEKISEIKFLEETHKISESQAVSKLQGVLRQLKAHHAPRSRIRDVEKEIIQAQEAGEKDFAVGNLAYGGPTLYGIRTLGPVRERAREHAKAVAEASAVPRVIGSHAQPITISQDVHHLAKPQFHQNNIISISLTGAHPGQFASEMERVFGSLTRSQLRSARLT